MRIVVFQYGDYGDVYRRFQSGGPETYRDQRHSVDFVASLEPSHEVATVAVCDRRHDEELAPGLRSIAGALKESKGVGDSIEAVAIANAAHAGVEFTLAGPGDVDEWTAFAQRHGVAASIRLLGVTAAKRVLTKMRDSDTVVVPSRHCYAEGLPNTVFEALASRSPLIASDHPTFVEWLRPGVDSLRFKAGHPQGLAEQVERLIDEPGLYARLSRKSASALSGLYVGIEWTELITHFIEDPLCTGDWVEDYSLAALQTRSLSCTQQFSIEREQSRTVVDRGVNTYDSFHTRSDHEQSPWRMA
jgi:glycosyltransferase involved in cell wall biosynthesis